MGSARSEFGTPVGAKPDSLRQERAAVCGPRARRGRGEGREETTTKRRGTTQPRVVGWWVGWGGVECIEIRRIREERTEKKAETSTKEWRVECCGLGGYVWKTWYINARPRRSVSAVSACVESFWKPGVAHPDDEYEREEVRG